eukprot:2088019-Rhodomonas_salina.1
MGDVLALRQEYPTPRERGKMVHVDQRKVVAGTLHALVDFFSAGGLLCAVALGRRGLEKLGKRVVQLTLAAVAIAMLCAGAIEERAAPNMGLPALLAGAFLLGLLVWVSVRPT